MTWLRSSLPAASNGKTSVIAQFVWKTDAAELKIFSLGIEQA